MRDDAYRAWVKTLEMLHDVVARSDWVEWSRDAKRDELKLVAGALIDVLSSLAKLSEVMPKHDGFILITKTLLSVIINLTQIADELLETIESKQAMEDVT